MRKNNSIDATVNQAMIDAIAQAVTIAVTQAIAGAVAIEEPSASPKASTSSKKSTSTKKSTSSKVSKGNEVESFKKAGCIGYYTKNNKLIPVASFNHNQKGYAIAEQTKTGAIVLTPTGKVQGLFDKGLYDAERTKVLSNAKKTGKKLPKTWKLDIYRKLGFYLTKADEKKLVLF